jgi:hypothetical protein
MNQRGHVGPNQYKYHDFLCLNINVSYTTVEDSCTESSLANHTNAFELCQRLRVRTNPRPVGPESEP